MSIWASPVLVFLVYVGVACLLWGAFRKAPQKEAPERELTVRERTQQELRGTCAICTESSEDVDLWLNRFRELSKENRAAWPIHGPAKRHSPDGVKRLTARGILVADPVSGYTLSSCPKGDCIRILRAHVASKGGLLSKSPEELERLFGGEEEAETENEQLLREILKEMPDVLRTPGAGGSARGQESG